MPKASMIWDEKSCKCKEKVQHHVLVTYFSTMFCTYGVWNVNLNLWTSQWFWWTDVVLWFKNSSRLSYSLHSALTVLLWIGWGLSKLLFLILGTLSKLFFLCFEVYFFFFLVVVVKYFLVLCNEKSVHDLGLQMLTAGPVRK